MRILMSWLGRTDIDQALGIGKSELIQRHLGPKSLLGKRIDSEVRDEVISRLDESIKEEYEEVPGENRGPIASVLDARAFDQVVILSNYPTDTGEKYKKALEERGSPPIHVHQVEQQFDPTDYWAIHGAVLESMDFVKTAFGDAGIRQSDPTVTARQQGVDEENRGTAEIDLDSERRASKERREASKVTRTQLRDRVDESELSDQSEDLDISVHVSSGTPSMHVIWVLVTKQWYPEAEIIKSSRQSGVETVEIPFDVQVLGNVLEQMAEGLAPATPAFDDILGSSLAMQEVKVHARRMAPFDYSVLIEGESGTGKELLARAIHSASARKEKKLVAINCGALPEGTVQSELFGHKKDAFTGATRDRKGCFEEASGGTLFLDEIGELSLPIQVMLLRVLQENEVSPMGTSDTVKVDVRLIAATNKNLKEEVRQGRFRGDLLQRLQRLSLRVPPLRERGDDVGIYIDQILAQINHEYRNRGFPSKKLESAARKILLRQPWSLGNYRELENAITQLLFVWSSDTMVSGQEVRNMLRGLEVDSKDQILGRSFDDGFNIEEVFGEVVGHYFDRALHQARGRKGEASKLVGFKTYQRFDDWKKKYSSWITYKKE